MLEGEQCCRNQGEQHGSRERYIPGREAREECIIELELAEKHYCNYLLVAICKNIFSEGEYSR